MALFASRSDIGSDPYGKRSESGGYPAFEGSYSSASSKSAKIVRAVPKADVQEDSTGGVQKFCVKLLAETYGQTTTDVLCHGEELKKLIASAVYIECSSKTQQNVKAVFEVTMLHLLNFRAKLACVVQAQSKSDSEKLIADLTNLIVSSHIRRQHELVDSRLLNFEIAKKNDEIIQQNDCMSEDGKASVSQILENVKTHEKSLESFQQDHCCQAKCIEDKAQETFQQRYTEYEPTGTTPSRSEPEVPSKATIESLRAMPMETLLEEFRENKS